MAGTNLAFPRRFLRRHLDAINRAYFDNFCPPVVHIFPREPLGRVTEERQAIKDLVVQVVRVRVVNERGTLRAYPETEADLRAAEEWEKRHEHTTDEEFDWVPF